MSSCKMTLIGLYNYDNSIFENLTFPVGVDKDLAINEILMECGEFEILYADIDFLKYQITKWGEKHYFTFEKWLKALAEEFNPIHNYDRYEEYTDTHSGSGKQVDSEKRSDSDNRMRSESGDASRTNDHTSNHANVHSESHDDSHTEEKTSDSTGASFTDTHSSTDDDVKRNVSAYDSSTYQPKEQEKTDGKTNGNGSGTSMSHIKDKTTSGNISANNAFDSASDSASDSETNAENRNAFESGSSTGTADRQSEHTNTDVNKHEAHLYGNIGVTTSVAMLTEYTNFYKDFNLYGQIAGLFVDEFCIRIY